MRSLDRLALVVSTLSILAGCAVGCGAPTSEGAEDDPATPTNDDELRAGSNSDRWVYNGLLPHLEDPSLVVAQTAHTVRVTGFLPDNYDVSKLPFYAKDGVEEVSGRTKISVVYPIATGESVNHQPDDYWTERVYPRRTDSSAPWGGFPFISYVNDDSPYKGIAFHGPITASDGEWKLIRGKVSHGCNRMQGEHVVELAHLIGVDMTTKLWSGDTILRNYRVPVKVVRSEPDSFRGRKIDVDYPAGPRAVRPTGNVKMFQAWRSQDFPSWVCKVDMNRPPPTNNVPANYCSGTLGLRDRANPQTGPGAGANGPADAPADGCSSATLGRTTPENACVQSSRDRTWYRCENTEWVSSTQNDPKCTEKHPL